MLAPVALNVVVAPTHIDDEPAVAPTVGSVLTPTLTVDVLLQPVVPSVPVTVYVVAVDGVAVTGEPVLALSDTDGDHMYVEPPVADNVVDEPKHTAGAPALALIVGSAFTDTDTTA